MAFKKLILILIAVAMTQTTESLEDGVTANLLPSEDLLRNFIFKYTLPGSPVNLIDIDKKADEKEDDNEYTECSEEDYFGLYPIKENLSVNKEVYEETEDKTTISPINQYPSETTENLTRKSRVNTEERELNLKFSSLKTELDTLQTEFKSTVYTLDKKLDDLNAQLDEDVKRLNNFEEKFKETVSETNSQQTTETNDIDTTEATTVYLTESEEETTTDAILKSATDFNLAKYVDDMSLTTQAPENDDDDDDDDVVDDDVVSSSTERNVSETTEDTTNDSVLEVKNSDAIEILGVGDKWEDSDWWSAFCQDPAKDAEREMKNWGPGVYPYPDMYDRRLKQLTGCESRMVPPYDKQYFQWYYGHRMVDWRTDQSEEQHFSPDSARILEQRLAVRSIANGWADIRFYWNGETKYFFVFENASNTLEFYRYSPKYEKLWTGDFSDSRWEPIKGVEGRNERREHYLPLHFTLEEDHLKFRAGCAKTGPVFSARIPTQRDDSINVSIETNAAPAKMLYDCPEELPLV